MKKLIYSVAVLAAFAFASCGGPSLCDCVNADKDDKDMEEKCKKYDEQYEKASDEEKEKLEEEAEACEEKK